MSESRINNRSDNRSMLSLSCSVYFGPCCGKECSPLKSQPQTSSLAHRLCCEERFKDVGSGLLAHAGSCVSPLQRPSASQSLMLHVRWGLHDTIRNFPDFQVLDSIDPPNQRSEE